MKDDIIELVNLLLKHRMTANQFVFLYLKVRQKDETLYRYLETTRPLSEKELHDLEERGLIINLNRSANDYWADQYHVSEGFANIIDPYLRMAEDFWNLYPITQLDGKRKMLLKSVDKIEFLFSYAFAVMLDSQLHLSAMRALRYLIGKEQVHLRIDHWFEQQKWKSVESELAVLRDKAQQTRLHNDSQL